MSATARSIGSSLRALSSANSSSSLACARSIIPVARAYTQAALQRRPIPQKHTTPLPRPTRTLKPRNDVYYPPDLKESHDQLSGSSTDEHSEGRRSLESRVPEHFAEYLNRLFAPLEFPPELAQRVLTHNSHVLARRGHNASLSFTGRRVLSAYLHFFLLNCPTLTPSHDIEQITANTLHTNLLGQHVAHEWGVGRVMIWQPSTPGRLSETNPKFVQTTGLYKVSGEAIQAMFGAIYNQFGGAVALQIFHTKLLPLLRVRGGLPKEFHEHASKMSREMGGAEFPEIVEETVQEEKVEDTSSKVETSS